MQKKNKNNTTESYSFPLIRLFSFLLEGSQYQYCMLLRCLHIIRYVNLLLTLTAACLYSEL